MSGVPYNFETETLKEITKPGDYPPGKCFVIQFWFESTIHHEGDERSRRCPGHGYPEWTERVTTVRTFVTRNAAEWRQKIKALMTETPGRTDFAAFGMMRAEIVTSIEVDVAELP